MDKELYDLFKEWVLQCMEIHKTAQENMDLLLSDPNLLKAPKKQSEEIYEWEIMKI